MALTSYWCVWPIDRHWCPNDEPIGTKGQEVHRCCLPMDRRALEVRRFVAAVLPMNRWALEVRRFVAAVLPMARWASVWLSRDFACLTVWPMVCSFPFDRWSFNFVARLFVYQWDRWYPEGLVCRLTDWAYCTHTFKNTYLLKKVLYETKMYCMPCTYISFF